MKCEACKYENDQTSYEDPDEDSPYTFIKVEQLFSAQWIIDLFICPQCGTARGEKR